MKTKINAVIKKVTLCYLHSYFATFKWVSQLIKLSDVWYSNLLYRNYPYFFSFHYTKQHKAIKHKCTKIILVFSTRLICLFRLSYSFHAKCVYEREGMHLLQNACFNYNRKRKKKYQNHTPKHPQNYKIKETFMLEGTSLSCSPTPLLKQGHLQEAVLDHGHLGMNVSMDEHSTSLGNLFQHFTTLIVNILPFQNCFFWQISLPSGQVLLSNPK